LATFGFPFDQARARGSRSSDPLRSPPEVARFVADGTSIGEGGQQFQSLVDDGRFAMNPFPADGLFAPRLGIPVATTPTPADGKRWLPLDAARHLAGNRDLLLVMGLGPRGLPKELLAHCPHHLELSGKGIPFETATALGAIPAMIRSHLEHLEARA
jgi:hypothetical protein